MRSFLYVSLQLLLGLEKEVITFATQLGFAFKLQVTVPQLKAIEINPYAFELAQVSVQIGYAHAQGRLGKMLLMRSRMTSGLKPDARAAIADEAFKWITLAANQGDKQGQANLADVCLEGKLVKQDLIEAYKWGELSSKGLSYDVAAVIGRSARDAAILKMNADQIAEARKRVAVFVPHQPQKSELPELAWVKKSNSMASAARQPNALPQFGTRRLKRVKGEP
jgi:Sel1 repeat